MFSISFFLLFFHLILTNFCRQMHQCTIIWIIYHSSQIMLWGRNQAERLPCFFVGIFQKWSKMTLKFLTKILLKIPLLYYWNGMEWNRLAGTGVAHRSKAYFLAHSLPCSAFRFAGWEGLFQRIISTTVTCVQTSSHWPERPLTKNSLLYKIQSKRYRIHSDFEAARVSQPVQFNLISRKHWRVSQSQNPTQAIWKGGKCWIRSRGILPLN